jgi:hypothetical protein
LLPAAEDRGDREQAELKQAPSSPSEAPFQKYNIKGDKPPDLRSRFAFFLPRRQWRLSGSAVAAQRPSQLLTLSQRLPAPAEIGLGRNKHSKLAPPANRAPAAQACSGGPLPGLEDGSTKPPTLPCFSRHRKTGPVLFLLSCLLTALLFVPQSSYTLAWVSLETHVDLNLRALVC